MSYLQAMREHPRFRLLKRGLAVLGRTGTLEPRLNGSRTRGRAQAKTGTLYVPSTSTLAGFVQPKKAALVNRELTFAFLTSGMPYLESRRLHDRMLLALINRR